jgi:hypothetical protein
MFEKGPVTATASFCLDVVVEETFLLESIIKSPGEYRVVQVVLGGVVEELFMFEVTKGGNWLMKGKFGRGCLVIQLCSSFIISTPISPTSSTNVVERFIAEKPLFLMACYFDCPSFNWRSDLGVSSYINLKLWMKSSSSQSLSQSFEMYFSYMDLARLFRSGTSYFSART